MANVIEVIFCVFVDQLLSLNSGSRQHFYLVSCTTNLPVEVRMNRCLDSGIVTEKDVLGCVVPYRRQPTKSDQQVCNFAIKY